MHEGFDWFNWVVLPLLIFCSRLFDVSLNTMRHVLIGRGVKNIVPLLGFFEVLIWLIVVSQVMKNLNNWLCYIAWAGGFATGSYMGLIIEEKLALGMQVIRIITHHNCDALIDALTRLNHGITVIDGKGAKGAVKILFTIVERKYVEDIARMIHEHNPTAFYSVEDVKDATKGVFSSRRSRMSVLRRIFPGK
jgi:uncharacterized protein YebE (UPF0316 family)